MSKRQVLSILGVWVMVLVFLGIPSFWIKTLYVITGLIIIAVSYNIPPKERKEKIDSFVENKKENNIDNKTV